VSRATAPAIPGLLLVGCGKMGGALLRGWLDHGMARRYIVVEPEPNVANVSSHPQVELLAAAEKIPMDFATGVIVLAVKPQTMLEVLPRYRRFAQNGALVLSIAAGKTLSFFARVLGERTAVVRAMPNTPAAIGRGIAVACANAAVAPAQRSLAERLLAAVGEVGWVADEALMDAVTAVSGSGPAYVFLLIECLTKAGVAAGLPDDLAARLARATVAGSGELARLSQEKAEALREAVTSPGGTTRAALDVLMAKDEGLETLLTRAVLAAAKRSRDLAD
jgi:pyrroline-5-carboxylate reductase